ncbi:polyphenol oxidase family protein [bacterium]|nr:polyphenol oxidase family protein [bacterium]
METLRAEGQFFYVRYNPWAEVPGLVHGVSLRLPERGRGEGLPFLGAELAARGFRDAFRLAQVHGQRVVDVGLLEGALGEAFSLEHVLEGDGLVGVAPGLAAVVSAADCVPVFVLARKARAWALLHAGWRGIAAGVLQAGLARLAELAGAAPQELEIYLGPAICGACYEVGREVAVWLGVQGPETPGFAGRTPGDGWKIDLRALLAQRAQELGVPAASIAVSRWCTRCHNDLFHSFRAEAEAGLGRMWAFMGFAATESQT